MKNPLWRPTRETIRDANVTRFMEYVNARHGLSLSSYAELYRWSVEHLDGFWEALWDFAGVIASRPYDTVAEDLAKIPSRFFCGARLNFAENLLRYGDSHTAFVYRGEDGRARQLTYAQLRDSVARLACGLGRLVSENDRVTAYMPALPETACAMLSATSLGATWSALGCEFGGEALIDRFGQLSPKVLFTVDGYPYKGKSFPVLDRIGEVARKIPSLERVIVVPYLERNPDISGIPNAVLYDEMLSSGTPRTPFRQLPADHPLYIMFSSGTTGKPKCMVQGAAGVLLNHIKELLLHTDLRREDRIFYITSPSWMMWHWVTSSLALGATIVLYNGNPLFPDWGAMWRLVSEEGITVFGCSATYLTYLKTLRASPKMYDLSSLREISQTGSPLSGEGFEWVYREIKEDVHLNSISGGTDINGCFAAGTPVQPVYAGELQGPALAMKINAFDERGAPLRDREGELVCEAPSPSMPLYFLGDDGTKYHDAYFSVYPGVWRHGDWVIFHSDTGGITFLGRSDFTLKPSGVRIGPSEIYRILERIPEIEDSLVAGQNWKDDQRIILFVKLMRTASLTSELKERIVRTLQHHASPRHAPALIVEVPDIPYTYNMKKVESAISNMLNGRPVVNREALANPESLDFFEKILPELRKDGVD